MKKKELFLINNEGGFVLVAAIMVLLILVIIGMSATTTSIIESQIAGADKAYKITFYIADGGTEVGSELIEQSASCPGGFASTSVGDVTLFDNTRLLLYQRPLASLAVPEAAGPTYDAIFTSTPMPATVNVYLTMGGITELGKGAALQQLAGYEGKGKAAAGGGISKLYDIYSRFYGYNNSDSLLLVKWRHVIGQEGACNY
jgi:hypothetical protein